MILAYPPPPVRGVKRNARYIHTLALEYRRSTQSCRYSRVPTTERHSKRVSPRGSVMQVGAYVGAAAVVALRRFVSWLGVFFRRSLPAPPLDSGDERRPKRRLCHANGEYSTGRERARGKPRPIKAVRRPLVKPSTHGIAKPE